MSHKQAKRLRRMEREECGTSELDRKREAGRLRLKTLEDQLAAVEKMRREHPEEYARLLARDREKFQSVLEVLLTAAGAILK